MRFSFKTKNEVSGEISRNKKTINRFNSSTLIILTIIFSIAVFVCVHINVDINYIWSNTSRQSDKFEDLSE